jgi:hypothetical protein
MANLTPILICCPVWTIWREKIYPKGNLFVGTKYKPKIFNSKLPGIGIFVHFGYTNMWPVTGQSVYETLQGASFKVKQD